MLLRIGKTAIQSLGYMSFLSVLSPAKVSWMIGSKAAFFSLNNCVSPLVGVFGNLSTTLTTFFLRSTLKIILGGAFRGVMLFNLPSLASALYFVVVQNNNFIKKSALTILIFLCIGAFILHPSGSQAAAYTLFWLIPLVALWVNHNSFFVHALGSTFTAHAVGSVLWLWQTALPAEYWLGMIPLVMMERLVFASGITIFYTIIKHGTLLGAHVIPVQEKLHA